MTGHRLPAHWPLRAGLLFALVFIATGIGMRAGLLVDLDQRLIGAGGFPSRLTRLSAVAGATYSLPIALALGLMARDWRRGFYYAFVAFALVSMIEVTCKLTVTQPAGALPHMLPFTQVQLDHPWPSGHSARAALLAALLFPRIPLMLRPLPLLFAGMVGVMLVSEGHHYPSDVIGGLALGLSGGLLAAGLADWRRSPAQTVGGAAGAPTPTIAST